MTANAEALVNPVNTVGVMGKGLALQFKQQYPENYKRYKTAANAGELQTGKMFVMPTHRTDGVKWIINFPTKKHWRNPSKMQYIKAGLDDLINVIETYQILSVALPALGCGLGGLRWLEVKSLIERKLGGLPGVEIFVYEPG